MDFVNSVITFVMGPYGVAIVSLLLFIMSEWRGLNPNIEANTVFHSIYKALGWVKEKQAAPKV